MTAYQHGGDIHSFAQKAGCTPEEVIDLSSNINFVKPHIDMDFNRLDISPYPNYDALYEAVALRYGVALDEMELFGGGSAAIFALLRHLQGRQGCPPYATLYSPAYLEYKKAATLFGYEVVQINRFESMDRVPPKGSLVIFVNPATPEGMVYDLPALLERWDRQACTVLIDESFIEFSNAPSVTSLIRTYPRLYILKSMTKYYGAAGIRIGTLISQASNITTLRTTEPLWKLSAFDTAYICAALSDSTFPERSAVENAKSKVHLIETLRHAPQIAKVYPGHANYVLVKLKNITANALQENLLPHRIMIRDCGNFDGLDAYHARIAVKALPAMQILREALDA